MDDLSMSDDVSTNTNNLAGNFHLGGDDDNDDGENSVDSEPVQYDAVTSTYEPQKPLRRTMSEATFQCGCCYELMVQPTTLNCGHSFCRLCLARWWQSSKDTTCPGCRQPWRGFPHINIIMRTTLEKLFPVPIAVRRGLLNDPENRKLLEEFEKFGKELQEQGKKKSTSGFCSGVVFSLIVVLVLVLVWGLRDDTNMLVRKPVSKWTPEEVSEWIAGLGTWSRENNFPQKFLDSKVNGRLLLGITEEDLRNPPFEIGVNLYVRTIMYELKTVKDLGVKPPKDLWEYKTMHEGKSIFLSYSLKDFPRIAMAYFYVFDYEDLFLPFFHVTCPPPSNESFPDDELFIGEPRDPTVEQWIDFIPKYIFFPYYLIAQFAWSWLDNHPWTCWFVIVNCALLTFIEATVIQWFWKRGARSIPAALRRHVLAMLGTAILVILWPVIPFFICDGMFYWALYLSPFMNLEKLYKILKGRH
ncbi:bifunctional apoptosis regulator-like [Ptychodera flava]|uniref:bifunctional apoptosis regulator-like n=1 Tax=Ptychodera flava TaxID=63121 RepID=UPI00396A316D